MKSLVHLGCVTLGWFWAQGLQVETFSRAEKKSESKKSFFSNRKKILKFEKSENFNFFDEKLFFHWKNQFFQVKILLEKINFCIEKMKIYDFSNFKIFFRFEKKLFFDSDFFSALENVSTWRPCAQNHPRVTQPRWTKLFIPNPTVTTFFGEPFICKCIRPNVSRLFPFEKGCLFIVFVCWKELLQTLTSSVGCWLGNSVGSSLGRAVGWRVGSLK